MTIPGCIILMLYFELTISSYWPKRYSELSPVTSSCRGLYNSHINDNHVKFARFVLFAVSVRVNSLSIKLIIPISTLTILDIRKTSSNNCLKHHYIHVFSINLSDWLHYSLFCCI